MKMNLELKKIGNDSFEKREIKPINTELILLSQDKRKISH